MSANVKLNLIYRNNNQYKTINDFLNSTIIRTSDNFEFNIYLYTLSNRSELENKMVLTSNNVNYQVNIIDNDFSNVIEIKKHIYHNIFLNEKIYIYDSCLLFNEKIIDINNNPMNSYVKHFKNGITYTFLFGYGFSTLLEDNFTSIFHDKLGDYVIEEYNVNIDTNFLNNYVSSSSQRWIIDIVIIKHILDMEFRHDVQQLIDSSKIPNDHIHRDNQFPHYLSCLVYLNLIDEALINNIKKNFFNSKSENSPTIQYYYELEIALNNTSNAIDIFNKIPVRLKNNFIVQTDQYKEGLINNLLELSINNSQFHINKVPNWIKLMYLPILDPHYLNITGPEKNEINNIDVHSSPKIILTKDDDILIEGEKITFYDKKLVYKDYELKDVNNFSIVPEKTNNDKYENFFIITSLNPITIIRLDKESKCVEFSRYNSIHVPYLNIVTNCIHFFNTYLGLIRCDKNLYRFITLSDSYQINNVSDLIYIEYNVKGLLYNNNRLYIISKNKNLLKLNRVDIVSMLNDINLNINIPNQIEFKINNINNIKLIIKNYDNCIQEYDSYQFNNDDETNLGIVEYMYNHRLLKFDKNYYYINKFVYLPGIVDIPDKTHEIYIHDSVNDEILYQYIQNEKYTIGHDFKFCKYMFIDHHAFEHLNSLQLSEILDYNVMIISLIDNSEIENNMFIKTYTSDSNLTKLFLFNIAKNDSYLSFIIEQIFEKKQYENRKEFMQIDKQNIFNETNIYKSIIKVINKEGILPHIPDKCNNELLSKIRCKLFDNDHSYNNLIKFTMYKNFDLTIGKIDDSTIISDPINKLNFLGNTCLYNIETDDIYDSVYLENLDTLTEYQFQKNIILILNNKIIPIIN